MNGQNVSIKTHSVSAKTFLTSHPMLVPIVNGAPRIALRDVLRCYDLVAAHIGVHINFSS